MKQVILKSLTLCNFKGEQARTTNFNQDVTTISGGNGLGKSRHFDAFIWLLFGKDAHDRKDYEIKTRVNGEELHKCECSVTGVIDVDGETITLKRSFVEDWVKPRGQVEQVYKGNHTECWWNDTPVNVSEYDKRIQSIIDSSVFKMITNPAFFVGMKWQLQREQLFQLAGVITDAEIAAGNPQFSKLLDVISGKSLADHKKELAARKKRLSEELKQIQPRIDQTQKMKPEPEDFAAIEAQIADIDKQIADIDAQIADVNTAIRKQYEAEQVKQSRVNDLTTQAQQLVFDAKSLAQEAAFTANAARRDKVNALRVLQGDLDARRAEVQKGQVDIARHHRDIEKAREQQAALREQWFAENAKEYAGETTCPHCGQALPDDMLAKAKQLFNDAKVAKCGEITNRGKEIGATIAEIETHVATQQEAIKIAKSSIENLNAQISALQTELDAMPEKAAATINPEEIPAWVKLQKQIADIKATITTDNTGVDTSALQAAKADWNRQRNELSTRLAKRGAIKRCNDEITNLEARGKELSQAIADIERDEYTVEQFTRAKIDECEKRINAKFKFVTFRLFDYTLDGNPVETCIPLCDGVPYGGANTASQVNAGLDIINALCAYYGICAPIFIDNRESVNNIIPVQSQIINLVVTNDNKLTIQ